MLQRPRALASRVNYRISAHGVPSGGCRLGRPMAALAPDQPRSEFEIKAPPDLRRRRGLPGAWKESVALGSLLRGV